MRLMGAICCCLIVLLLGGTAAGAPKDVSICPIADALATDMHLKQPKLDFGTTDAIFLATAELAGYFDGDPKLTLPAATTVSSLARNIA